MDISKLQAVYDGIVMLKKELTTSNIPLIGFAGSPFTVACYLIEKGSSKTFSTIHDVISHHPTLFKQLLSSLTFATIEHLKQQIKHGVEAIQLFDTWGSILTGDAYQTYTYESINTIVNALQPYDIPVILYSKQSQQLISKLSTLPINVLSVDWNSSLTDIKNEYPHLALQGNLNPHVLIDNKNQAIQDTKNICQSMAKSPGFIFNLGHGILPKNTA